MGHSIPVFFLPMAPRGARPAFSDWNDAVALVPSDWWDDIPGHRIRESTSRNWWHLWALETIWTRHAVGGLEFVKQEAAWLEKAEISLALEGLDFLFALFSRGAVAVSGTQVTFTESTKAKDALETARPLLQVTDHDFAEDAESFFCFVKSLREALQESDAEGKCFLWISPQP